MRQWTRVWSAYTWWLPEVDFAKCLYSVHTGQSLDKQLRSKAKELVGLFFEKLRSVFAKHTPDPPPFYEAPHYQVPYPSMYSFNTLRDMAYFDAYRQVMSKLHTYEQFPTADTLAKIVSEAPSVYNAKSDEEFKRRMDTLNRLDDLRRRSDVLRLYPVYSPIKLAQVGGGSQRSSSTNDATNDQGSSKKSHENSIKIITAQNNNQNRIDVDVGAAIDAIGSTQNHNMTTITAPATSFGDQNMTISITTGNQTIISGSTTPAKSPENRGSQESPVPVSVVSNSGRATKSNSNNVFIVYSRPSRSESNVGGGAGSKNSINSAKYSGNNNVNNNINRRRKRQYDYPLPDQPLPSYPQSPANAPLHGQSAFWQQQQVQQPPPPPAAGPFYGHLPENRPVDSSTSTLDLSHLMPLPFGPNFASTHAEWVDYFEQLILGKLGLIDQIKAPDTYLACAQSYTFVMLLRLIDSIVGRI